MDWLETLVLLVMFGSSVYLFFDSRKARSQIQGATTINAANEKLAAFIKNEAEGQWYVIDLNYRDLLDPFEDPPEEGPFDMWATGPFDSYLEAQDYGNRNLQFFAVVTLT